MKRRHFLQFAGSTLATLGLSQLDIIRQGDRYGKVLAQSTPRKLALLVGINDYPHGVGWNPLRGCYTDVLMQKNLLKYGFGFQEEDILVLTDTDNPTNVTRDRILTAFEEHLIAQAKPGDVVVFHYSGHGSQVYDPDAPDRLNGTFVPIDSPLPSEDGGTVNDIMGQTLFLLMKAVDTENLTVVLDSCHSGGGTRGNMTVRSRSGGGEFLPSDEERAFQEKWMSELDLSEEELKDLRENNIAKGVAIASAQRHQLAADVPFNGFHAGAFTYLMTRYLWQQTNPDAVYQVLENIRRSTRTLARESGTIQEPLLETNPDENRFQPLYFIDAPRPAAEAVVTQVSGDDRVELWLGGVDRYSWEGFDEGTVLSSVNCDGQDPSGEDSRMLIQLENREGLIGRGRIIERNGCSSIEPGMFFQEEIRSIHKDLNLKVGIDDRSLDAESVSTARQALNAQSRIQGLSLGTQEVQYIFAQMTSEYRQQLETSNNLPPVGSLGLLTPALNEVVPDSFGVPDESISDAVERLEAKLQSLFAVYLVKRVLSSNSSRLDVEVVMQLKGGQVQAEAVATRGRRDRSPEAAGAYQVPQMTQYRPGDTIEFVFKNNENSDLYVCVLLISPDGSLTAIFPSEYQNPIEASLVWGNSTRIIPEQELDDFEFQIGDTSGFAEVLIVASKSPLREALRTLQATVGRGHRGPATASEEIADALLSDFDRGTRGTRNSAIVAVPRDRNGIDMTRMAALSVSFEIVRG